MTLEAVVFSVLIKVLASNARDSDSNLTQNRSIRTGYIFKQNHYDVSKAEEKKFLNFSCHRTQKKIYSVKPLFLFITMSCAGLYFDRFLCGYR